MLIMNCRHSCVAVNPVRAVFDRAARVRGRIFSPLI